ncbi:hypothetical protein Dcar01_00077 [Deinococcus carri]|uniref:Uncharacterized protein n=1 Tax=Deinococcus carri TaxID=1211323 RepID=A0ABP9W4D1_9DEIO
MFGLFKKKRAEEPHLRQGVEVGEMLQGPIETIEILSKLDSNISNFKRCNDITFCFAYNNLIIEADSIKNLSELSLLVRIRECRISSCKTIPEKALAYRCIDHVCFKVPGVRAFFDPATGELMIGVQSDGFFDQYRADTLIDIALNMLERGVMEARSYLGLPTQEVEPVQVDQWDGGYHFGGFSTYRNAQEAFVAYMVKKKQCEEIGREGNMIFLQSGPVRYAVRAFGWPNGYMVGTSTPGFKHAYQDDERYVRIQERLAQDIHKPHDQDPRSVPMNFRDPRRSTIAYFQPDGTFVLGEYGFANTRSNENDKAFGGVATAQMINVFYMTYLAEELPEDLYSDTASSSEPHQPAEALKGE